MKPAKTKLLVIGLDGAAHKIIKSNLNRLPFLKALMQDGFYSALLQKPPLFSPGLWTTIFSGVPQKKHKITNFVKGKKLLKREDIPVRFIWDELDDYYKVKVLQVPIICPPYNFNADFKPIDNGLSVDLNDLARETDALTLKTLSILKSGCDLVISVFTALDRLQHFHWGEKLVVSWYEKFDQIIALLAKQAEKLIIVSDHGFCNFKEAKFKTLPKVNAFGQKLRGDHHPEAIFISKNIGGRINKAEQIYSLIKKEFV